MDDPMTAKTLRRATAFAHGFFSDAGFPFVLLCFPLFWLHCRLFEREYRRNVARIRALARGAT